MKKRIYKKMHFLMVQFESFTSNFSGANNFDQFLVWGQKFYALQGQKFDHEIPLGENLGGTSWKSVPLGAKKRQSLPGSAIRLMGIPLYYFTPVIFE